ncbi:Crp/Fnr family transcriptional regulator [Turicibacter sanguinis]|uniref:Crp/Fnr family transcriptional regulator n=1 Tax=Turicibacter sanguinis TaxID=154288 RepID=UPI001EEBBD59|nr:helix-turn-helix domain-containing protein [Turicibacter sanguinis]MCU7212244.1 helix-turn-helix domain-containing protein [Turicibacter sanguinis]
MPTSDGYVIDIPLSVVYLSQLVGAQRETVSRALKKLIDAGLVRYEHKKIYISDLKALGDYHKTK